MRSSANQLSPQIDHAGRSGGCVYLIHFDQPYRHARHYIGWTTDLERRLAQHEAGEGARLMEVIASAGIGWICVRIWPGPRRLERAKKTHARRYCPLCRDERIRGTRPPGPR